MNIIVTDTAQRIIDAYSLHTRMERLFKDRHLKVEPDNKTPGKHFASSKWAGLSVRLVLEGENVVVLSVFCPEYRDARMAAAA